MRGAPFNESRRFGAGAEGAEVVEVEVEGAGGAEEEEVATTTLAFTTGGCDGALLLGGEPGAGEGEATAEPAVSVHKLRAQRKLHVQAADEPTHHSDYLPVSTWSSYYSHSPLVPHQPSTFAQSPWPSPLPLSKRSDAAC